MNLDRRVYFAKEVLHRELGVRSVHHVQLEPFSEDFSLNCNLTFGFSKRTARAESRDDYYQNNME